MADRQPNRSQGTRRQLRRGVAALIMTGTLYGTAHFHWAFGFFFGASIGALAALVIGSLCKPPTVEQMEAAVRAHEEAAARKGRAKPAVAA
jgi:hypothetical protein